MTEQEIIEKLQGQGVTPAAIAVLTEQEMLDVTSLTNVTQEALVVVGIKLGSAVKIKVAFPSTPAAAAAPVVSEIKVVESKRTNQIVLDELAASPTADVIAEARTRFKGRCLVPTTEGKLDVAGTLDALEFIARIGESPKRFKNSQGVSVALVNIDGLLATVLDLNPLTGELLAPGDPMLEELTRDQRLLIAFAFQRKAVKSDENPDLLINQVTAGKGRWAQLAADLLTAQRTQHPDVAAAQARIQRVSGVETSTPGGGGGSGSGSPDARERRLSALLHGRAPFTGELKMMSVVRWLEQNYSLEELKLMVAQLSEWMYMGEYHRLDWDNISGQSKSSKVMSLVEDVNRHGFLVALMVPFGREAQPSADWQHIISTTFSPQAMEAMYQALGENFADVSCEHPDDQAKEIIARMKQRGETELISDFCQRGRKNFPELQRCFLVLR